jgi:hypothetical protein
MVGNLHVLDQTAHGDNPGTQLDEQNLVMFNSDIAIQKGIEKSCYISSGYDAVGAECSVGQPNVTLAPSSKNNVNHPSSMLLYCLLVPRIDDSEHRLGWLKL